MSDRLALIRRFLPARWNGHEPDVAHRVLESGTKAKAMVHSSVGGQGSWLFDYLWPGNLLPRTKKDYAAKAGDGLGSSVLAGPLNFMMRTFGEAPPMVERVKRQAETVVEDQHPMIRLLAEPNRFYSGEVLWMCTVLDFCFGNAYWYKVRNEGGEIIELWWIPRAMIRPRWPVDGSEYVSHYEYRPGAQSTPIRMEVKDVLHLRFGLDPRNPRLGLSQLGALMREIGIDDEAANFTASILENMGIIGVIISPKEKGGVASREALQSVKEFIQKSFTGDKRGETLAVGAPTEAQVLQYNLQGFDISPLRDVSEERVCAALGLPAAVVGFGTGLQQTKVGATMKEMRQLAWTGGIIPLQRIIAAEIQRSLLPEFEKDKRQRATFEFDISRVRALWEDASEKHDRIRKDFQAKLIDRATALREMGRPWTDADKGIYSTGPLPTDEPKPKPPPASGGENA